MTKEDINKIAKEYAEWLAQWFPEMKERNKYRDKMSQAKNVIRLIQRDYIIVPKSKVREIFAIAQEQKKSEDEHTALAGYERAVQMMFLFGKDFLKKGE